MKPATHLGTVRGRRRLRTLLAIAVLIPATVLIVNTLALWAGHMVGRRHMPAEALRTA